MHVMRRRGHHLLSVCVAALTVQAGPLKAEDAPAEDSALTAPISPQASPAGSRFSVGLGAVYLQVRDDIVAPMRWDGPGGALEFRYEILRQSYRHQIGITFPALAFVKNRYDHEGATPFHGVCYRYLRNATALGERAVLRAGGQVQWVSSAQFYYDWDEEHLYWMSTIDLAPVVSYETKLGPRRLLLLECSVPVASFVSRPPVHRYYKNDDLRNLGFWFSRPNERFELTSLHEQVAMAGAAMTTVPLSTRWGLGLAYEFAYRRFTEPKPIRTFTNVLSVRAIRGI